MLFARNFDINYYKNQLCRNGLSQILGLLLGENINRQWYGNS